MCLVGRGKEKLWFRQHLEPLKRSEQAEYFSPKWTEKNPENDMAWHDGDLTDALNAILARRVMRVGQSGAKGWPDEAKRFARLDDITDFIEGRTNDDLLADLIWGLSLLDWQKVKPVVVRISRCARSDSVIVLRHAAALLPPFQREGRRHPARARDSPPRNEWRRQSRLRTRRPPVARIGKSAARQRPARERRHCPAHGGGDAFSHQPRTISACSKQ